MCENDCDIGEIQGRGGDVEDGDDGLRAAEADAVEQDAEGYDEPDGMDGRACIAVDGAPEPGGR